jgi:hypothetical protein
MATAAAAASSGAAVIFSNLAQPEVAFDSERQKKAARSGVQDAAKAARDNDFKCRLVVFYARSFLPVMRVREREKREEERRQRVLV